MDSLLAQIRISRGLTLADVAARTGLNQGTLSRIERGKLTPARPTARKLFEFYGGAVPMHAIYDPEHYAAVTTHRNVTRVA